MREEPGEYYERGCSCTYCKDWAHEMGEVNEDRLEQEAFDATREGRG